MIFRYLSAIIVSLVISFVAHKIIAIPELYFIIGAIDAFFVLAIFGNLKEYDND